MKRIFPIGPTVLGTLLTISAFDWLYFGNPFKAAETIALPDESAGLPRTDLQTGTYSESSTSTMVESMREKIAEGNSHFTPLAQTNDNDRLVYVLEGMGQKHFYFQSKNLVIWVAADPALADTVIQQTLEVYP